MCLDPTYGNGMKAAHGVNNKPQLDPSTPTNANVGGSCQELYDVPQRPFQRAWPPTAIRCTSIGTLPSSPHAPMMHAMWPVGWKHFPTFSAVPGKPCRSLPGRILGELLYACFSLCRQRDNTSFAVPRNSACCGRNWRFRAIMTQATWHGAIRRRTKRRSLPISL